MSLHVNLSENLFALSLFSIFNVFGFDYIMFTYITALQQ